ncbi:unnamed protein product, partial [Rotaria socialis]
METYILPIIDEL